MSRTRIGFALLLVSAGAIGIATLTPGAGNVSSTLCMFCGDRGVADFLSNVLLFAPFGVAVGFLTGSMLAATAAAVLFSLGIEAAQVTVIVGRDANAGDLVANGVGALLGWRLCRTRRFWLATEGASRRALLVTSATLGVVLVGLSLLAPSFPQRPYYLQWTARFAGMPHYDGRVLSAQVDGLTLPGPWRIGASDRVRELLAAGAPLDFRAVAGRAPEGLAPILSIYDDWKREIVLIGAHGTDLIFRYRTRADELRLDRGGLRIPGALRNANAGSPLRIAVQKHRNDYCIEVNSNVTCSVGFTVADTWTLLIAPALNGRAERIVGILWLCCLFVPSGLLVGTRRSAIFLAGIITIVLWAGPYTIGFRPTPAHQLAAACAGLGGGMLLRAALLRRQGGAGPARSERRKNAVPAG